MNLFSVNIKDLTLEVIIGVLENERKNRQKIVLNAVIEYDLDEHFLDYTQAVEAIVNLLEYKMYDTLENALTNICKALKLDFPEIKTIKMSIAKPQIYKNCLVGVEILKKY
jgi:dihydroneopterin aldolase